MIIPCNGFLKPKYINSRGEANFNILNSINIQNNPSELYESLTSIFNKLENGSYIYKSFAKKCEKMKTIDIGDKYLKSSTNANLGFNLILNEALFNSVKFSETPDRQKFMKHIKYNVLKNYSLIETSPKQVFQAISNSLFKEREFIPLPKANCSIGTSESVFLAKLISDNYQNIFPNLPKNLFQYNFVDRTELEKAINFTQINHEQICDDINSLPHIRNIKLQSFLLNNLTIDEFNNYFQSKPNNKTAIIEDFKSSIKLLANLSPNELENMYKCYSYKEQKSTIKNKLKFP